MKAVTGQYECVHSSGVGLDYFTARIDQLILYPDNRFALIIQQRSRAVHAAQSFIKGEKQSMHAPESRKEGTYSLQNTSLTLTFDDGGIEYAQFLGDSNELHIGPNTFQKISDSTTIPPMERLKHNMDDIAQGMKIAGTLGNIAQKAWQTLQNAPSSSSGSDTSTVPPSTQPSHPSPQPSSPSGPPQQPPFTPPPAASPSGQPLEARYCDNCGAPRRPGKHFCNMCGARFI